MAVMFPVTIHSGKKIKWVMLVKVVKSQETGG